MRNLGKSKSKKEATSTLLKEEKTELYEQLGETVHKETNALRKILLLLTIIAFVAIGFAIAISITALFRAETKDNKIQVIVRENNIYLNTSVQLPVTTGVSVTTGLSVDNDHSFNVSYFLDKSNFIPHSLRISFDPQAYGSPCHLRLQWDVLNSNYISGYNVYQSHSTVSVTTATKVTTSEKQLKFNSGLFSGKVYFRVETVFVDSSVSVISEEFIYDSNSKLLALGNPLGDTSSDNDLFIFDDLTIVDSNGASKRTVESTLHIADITYSTDFHFCSNGQYAAWVSNNLNDSSSRTALMVARTFGNTTSFPLNYNLLQNTTSQTFAFGFSRDCTRIYFVCNCTSTVPQLFVSLVNGSNIVQVSETGTVDFEGVQYDPTNRVSPLFTDDSESIIWSQRDNDIDVLLMRNVNISSDSVQLDDADVDASPAGTYINSFKITPDGRYVIYSARQDSLNRYDLYKVLLGIPGTKTRLTPSRVIGSTNSIQLPFFITPNSDFVVYSFVTTTSYRTYYSTPISSDGTLATIITQTPSLGYSFPVNLYDVISPDGSLFAFTVINSTHCEIYVGSIRGRFDPYMVTSGESVTGCSVSSFKWSRVENDRYLVMHSKYDLSYPMIYVVDTKMLTTTRVSVNTLANAHATDYVLTDDGKSVLFISDERSNGRNEIFINSIPPVESSRLFGAVGSLTRDYTKLSITSIAGVQYRLDG